MKPHVIGDALHVELPHRQAAPRRRINDAQKTQGLGRLARADPAHAKAVTKLLLGRQPVTEFETILNYELLDPFGDGFTKILPFKGFWHRESSEAIIDMY